MRNSGSPKAMADPSPRVRRAVFASAWLLTLSMCSFAIIAVLGWESRMFDEFIPVVNAMLIEGGSVPHRDFVSVYTPLNFYIAAAAMRVFGPSIVAVRLVQGLSYLVVV